MLMSVIDVEWLYLRLLNVLQIILILNQQLLDYLEACYYKL